MSAKPGVELLSDLADRIAMKLSELGIDPDRAADISQAVSDDMAGHWGGQLVYFPKGMYSILSKRDRQIYADFSGHNHDELAEKYGVCVQTIYRIVKLMRRASITDLHDDLFPSSLP